jgi:hypothetical protein
MVLPGILFALIFIGFHVFCIFAFYSALRSGKVSLFWINADRSERPILFLVTLVMFFLFYLIFQKPWTIFTGPSEWSILNLLERKSFSL